MQTKRRRIAVLGLVGIALLLITALLAKDSSSMMFTLSFSIVAMVAVLDALDSLFARKPYFGAESVQVRNALLTGLPFAACFFVLAYAVGH